MIFGHIDNLDLMRSTLPAPVILALEHLKNTDYSASPGGTEIRIAPGISGTDARLTTKSPRETRGESHRANIDVQFLISGRERIGVAADLGVNPVAEDKLAELDVLFYASVNNESFLDLEPGSFVVFFPYDAHRPACSPGARPEEVHKVVIKIRAELLV